MLDCVVFFKRAILLVQLQSSLQVPQDSFASQIPLPHIIGASVGAVVIGAPVGAVAIGVSVGDVVIGVFVGGRLVGGRVGSDVGSSITMLENTSTSARDKTFPHPFTIVT